MAYRGESKPAADFLADVGRFLYGQDSFLGPLAAALGVKPSMLAHWLKGKSKLNSDHPVLKEALGLVLHRLQTQADGWQARCDELEEAARPDAPANDAGFPPKIEGFKVGDRVRAPFPLSGPPTESRDFVISKVGPERAKVRRHK